MTTDSADFQHAHELQGPVPIDELIRRQGVPAIRTIDDLANDDVFETGEELDEFLVFVAEERHSNVA